MSLAQLKARSKQSLANLARKRGIPRSHSMGKDQLIRCLATLRNGRRKPSKPRRTRRAAKAKTASVRNGRHKISARTAGRNGRNGHNGDSTKVLGVADSRGMANGHVKDRIVLLVRDPHWLHAYWAVTLASVHRAEAALREDWHGAKPILRVFDVSSEDTTSSSEAPIRDIDIHGSVNNWYIDVPNPPRSYRVDIGYVTRRGRFYTLAHSNVVTTPRAGDSDVIDENWASVQEQFEKIYAMAGSVAPGTSCLGARQLSEDRTRRPAGSGPVSSFGLGAMAAARKRRFWFHLDAELIVYGSTQPSSRVSLQGESVQLRSDGTFTMRFRLPDKRLIIPATATSPDANEERTIVLAVERNTKELEPMVHENRGE
jgi:hypothetical protein